MGINLLEYIKIWCNIQVIKYLFAYIKLSKAVRTAILLQQQHIFPQSTPPSFLIGWLNKFWDFSEFLIGWLIKLSVSTTNLNLQKGNFVYHYLGSTSIYRPLPCPFRSLMAMSCACLWAKAFPLLLILQTFLQV